MYKKLTQAFILTCGLIAMADSCFAGASNNCQCTLYPPTKFPSAPIRKKIPATSSINCMNQCKQDLKNLSKNHKGTGMSTATGMYTYNNQSAKNL